MKTRILMMIMAITMITPVYGQEFKLAKSTGKLEIKEVNKVSIEGYNGNEIIFSSRDARREKDTRADGLRAVSSMGLEDNTGLGLSVVEKEGVIQVTQLKKMDGPNIKIMVPKGVSVSYVHSSPYGDAITFKNVESEIQASTVHNAVHLENVTGPVSIKTVHGEIEADFNANMKSPILIASVHGLVDVTVPVAIKANMSLSTTWGEIFLDPAIKIETETKSDWVKYGSGKLNGKVNGGGIDFTLSSDHSNIYLRKK